MPTSHNGTRIIESSMHIVTHLSRPVGTAMALALTCLLGACDRPDLGAHTSQVAAKVNGDEITVSQLNFVLSRLGVANQQQAKQAQDKALDSLIDTHLLAKQALDQGLDREPQVLHALQYARQQVLAQAYIDRVVSQKGLHKPGESEIKDYYDKHPELFAKRRVYRLRHISVQGDPSEHEQVLQELGRAESFDALSRWLKGHDIKFTAQDQTRPAEDLPLGLLPKLNELREGAIIDTSANGTLQALELLGSEEHPLTRAQAAPLIKRFLLNRSRMDLARAEIKRLRESAKIELAGPFKEAAPGRTPAAPAVAETPHGSTTGESDFMKKGLSGLK